MYIVCVLSQLVVNNFSGNKNIAEDILGLVLQLYGCSFVNSVLSI